MPPNPTPGCNGPGNSEDYKLIFPLQEKERDPFEDICVFSICAWMIFFLIIVGVPRILKFIFTLSGF